MRIRGMESLLGRAGWSALAFAIVWLAWNGEHVSVPAGALHIQSALATAPDNTRPDPAADNFVSVAEMQASSCPAGSRIRDTRAIGGFGTSNNLPRPVAMSTGGQGLFLLAQPEVVMADTRGRGMRLALVNRTPHLLAFEALDSRLPIVQEAQDADGNWRRIESQIGSDCGCSAHRVFLPRNCFWAFHVPRYKGPLATKLRFAMSLRGGLTLYSNVFDGSIHPAQFILPRNTP